MNQKRYYIRIPEYAMVVVGPIARITTRATAVWRCVTRSRTKECHAVVATATGVYSSLCISMLLVRNPCVHGLN